MRPLVDRPRLTRFLQELGRRVRTPTRLYLVGGSSALVEGWRASTADIDFVAEPESRELLECLPDLKNRLDISVEIASPAHFVPEVAGWRHRSTWIEQHGKLQVYHYDFLSQLLAKIERGHRQDLLDAAEMLRSLDPAEVWRAYERMEADLLRYPAIDPGSFRAKVRSFLDTHRGVEE